MNLDIRVTVSFRNHRKRKRLKLILGPGSTDYLIDLWIATAMNHPSGILAGMDETDIALEAGWEGEPAVFVDALMQSGFLDKEDGTYSLHDWAEHQAYVVKAPGRKAAAKHAASKRWEEKRGVPACGENAEGMPGAMRNSQKGNAPLPSPLPLPSPSPDPDPEDKESSLRSDSSSSGCPDDPSPNKVQAAKNGPPDCPHQRVIDLYREILPELPAPRVWNEERQKQLRSRWREAWERLKDMGKPHDGESVLAWWRTFFSQVKASPWLMGQVENKNGTPPFLADLEWLTRPRNFAKVIDGKYLDRGKS